MKATNRRKNFLTNKPLQLRYVSYVVATLVVVCGIGLVGYYYGIWSSVLKSFSQSSVQETLITAAQIHEYEEARRPSPDRAARTSLRKFEGTDLLSAREQEIIKAIVEESNRRILTLGTLLILLIGIGSIYITHKIAGPIFKLKQYFRKIEAGDLTPRIHFRKFDETQKLAPSFNTMMKELDHSIGEVKRVANETPPHRLRDEVIKSLSRFKTTHG